MITGNVCTEPDTWNEIVYDFDGHPLQLWGWGELKAAHNWRAERIMFTNESGEVEGGAQVLLRRLPGPFGNLVYVPRGPFTALGNEKKVLSALKDYAKKHYNPIAVTVEPDAEAWEFPEDWHTSDNTILIPRTLVLNLEQTEEELLQAATKKTRQYIRKSGRENVQIKRVKSREELAQCLTIYHQTAERAGFALHGDDYYYDVHDKLGESSVVMASYFEGKIVAFLWLAISASTAFELYGGMNDKGQELRANYALKWHTITACKEWGIERYDMNGLLNDGVSTFKKGFAEHETMLVGTYDTACSPLYPLWSKGLPLAKKIIRTIKR
jgi:lipid II:glycine glycyltransferase (peptidoglycan interpeptide bridge formation enzyme)